MMRPRLPRMRPEISGILRPRYAHFQRHASYGIGPWGASSSPLERRSAVLHADVVVGRRRFHRSDCTNSHALARIIRFVGAPFLHQLVELGITLLGQHNADRGEEI